MWSCPTSLICRWHAKHQRKAAASFLYHHYSVELPENTKTTVSLPPLRLSSLWTLFLSLFLRVSVFFRALLKSEVGLPNTQNAQTSLSGPDAKLPWSELKKSLKTSEVCTELPPPPPSTSSSSVPAAIQSGGAQLASNFFLQSIFSKWCALRVRNVRAPSAN